WRARQAQTTTSMLFVPGLVGRTKRVIRLGAPKPRSKLSSCDQRRPLSRSVNRQSARHAPKGCAGLTEGGELNRVGPTARCDRSREQSIGSDMKSTSAPTQGGFDRRSAKYKRRDSQ